jgi:hypothetical protein
MRSENLIGQSTDIFRSTGMFDPTDQLLTIEQSMSVLSKQWFAKQRCMDAGPEYVKIGNRVFYKCSSLVAFAERHAIKPAVSTALNQEAV